MTHRYSDDPPLDALLDASRPPTPLADALTPADVAAAVDAARRRSGTGRPGRASRRPALTATTAVLLGVAGVGAAAAAVTAAEWSPWAQDPDVAFTYTLPSGAVCEERIGDVAGADPVVVAAVRDFFQQNDVLEHVDVDAQIAVLRSPGYYSVTLDDGSVVEAPYGSAHYMSPDREYQSALSTVVGQAFAAELERRGIELGTAGAYDSFGGETWCPDAEW